MIPWLDEDNPTFPPPSNALNDPDGLLAAGGNLNAQTLLDAYRQGIFPWYSDPDPILWWSPDPRCILEPHHVHISKSMKKVLKRNHFSVTWNSAFLEVIQACAAARAYTKETWITDHMLEAYMQLHRKGIAHSLEVWQDNKLVGGLYGLAIGAVFFGESMFSIANNSSKFAFIKLCESLEQSGFRLIDCQVESEHLCRLGAYTVPRDQFLLQLKSALTIDIKQAPWSYHE